MNIEETLGVTKEQLLNLVVNNITNEVISESNITHEKIIDQLQIMAIQRVDESLLKICEDYVFPFVEDMVKQITIERTNSFGELKGEPMTLTEYMVEITSNYIFESIDSAGRPKSHREYRHDVKNATRLEYIIDKYQATMIENSIKDALKDMGPILSTRLSQSVKESLEKLINSISSDIIKNTSKIK